MRPVYRALFRENNTDTGHSILVAGTARSGTTWLGELIASQISCRIMFEPFHARKIREFRAFEYFQYKRPEADDPALESYCRTVFAGAIRHRWIDRELDRVTARYRLIKEIRANLFLGWIRRRFPVVPIAFIVRHPCAVVESRLALNWATDSDLASFKAQPELLADLTGPQRTLLEGARSPAAKHALIWCISNLIPVAQVERGMYPLTFYEHLLDRPESEIPRIFAAIGQPYDPSVFASLRRPSSTSKGPESDARSGRTLHRWQTTLSPGQIDDVLRVVEGFGLTRLYDEAPMPRVDSIGPSAPGTC